MRVPPVASVALLAALFLPGALPAQRGPAQDRILVQLAAANGIEISTDAAGIARTGLARVDRLNARHGVVTVEALIPEGAGRSNPAAFARHGLDRTYVFRFDGERLDPAAVAADYDRLEEIAYASEDGTVFATLLPDDPSWGSQWGPQKIDCPEAWSLITDSRGTPVAILDSGLDQDHPDILENRWVNGAEIPGNGIDDDGNGYVDDVYGWDFANKDNDPDDDYYHGTHVSGIVGAHGNNGLMIAGISWRADIQALKVLDRVGSGSSSGIAAALVYAADNGARVANMSFGNLSSDRTVGNAVDYAVDSGVLLVASAGNHGTTDKLWPAAYPKVMGVIATDGSDLKPAWSAHGDWCDLAAPGDDILSLWNDGGTGHKSGTSMAAPHVAGVATLVRSIHPTLSWRQTRQILNWSTVDLGAAGFDDTFGWGRLQAGRAVKMAASLMSDDTKVADGSSTTIHVSHPNAASQLYVLLPSTQGFDTGIPLAGFDPTDTRRVPVDYDSFFMPWVMTTPNNGIFIDFIGTLDGSGRTDAIFNVPRNLLVGERFDFSGVTFDPTDLNHVQHVLGMVRIRVTD